MSKTTNFLYGLRPLCPALCMQRGVAAKQKSPNGDEERADSPSLFVIQLILERWSNPGIPSKNELGNCNTVKNWGIVILPILALNSQKKSF